MAYKIMPGNTHQKGEYSKKTDSGPFRSKAYLEWLRTLPCVIRLNTSVRREAHHVRLDAFKMGVRVPDSLCVPLSYDLHGDQHKGSLHDMGERKFWSSHGINPIKLADDLFEVWVTCAKSESEQLAIAVMKLRHAIAASRRV